LAGAMDPPRSFSQPPVPRLFIDLTLTGNIPFPYQWETSLANHFKLGTVKLSQQAFQYLKFVSAVGKAYLDVVSFGRCFDKKVRVVGKVSTNCPLPFSSITSCKSSLVTSISFFSPTPGWFSKPAGLNLQIPCKGLNRKPFC